MDRLRQKVPGLLASKCQVELYNKSLEREFEMFLSQQKTNPSWYVNPSRPVKLFIYLYFWLRSDVSIDWRIYGDGRIAGKRHLYCCHKSVKQCWLLPWAKISVKLFHFPVTMFYDTNLLIQQAGHVFMPLMRIFKRMALGGTGNFLLSMLVHWALQLATY